jgi:VanZ family protein
VKGLRELPHLRWWLLLGRLWLLATVVICLVPMPRSPIPIEGSDKLEHALGWLLITLWYAQLTRTRQALLARACGFVALGAAIELAQSLTTWRSADAADLLANLVGVILGVALGLSPLGGVLARLDRR